MLHLSIVGHIAIDTVIDNRGTRMQLGGPPTYAALTARVMGLEAEAITKAGEDLPEEFKTQLREMAIEVPSLKERKTTRFILDYRRGERKLVVEAICDKITPNDIPTTSLEVVLLSPIIGEVPRGTAYQLLSVETLALDPQGYLRDVGIDGRIYLKPWLDVEILSAAKIYKSTVKELKMITGITNPLQALARLNRLGIKEAIVTLGGRGALLSINEQAYEIPPYRVDVVDPTGAGDVFLAAYLSESLMGGEPTWCGAVATAAASLILETIGARFDASQRELYRRAEETYERVIRL